MSVRRVLSVLLLAALMLSALAIAPFAGAQEGPKPEAVGLRPDAPPYALHGPYWVGAREFVIEPDSERPLPLTVWYPALNPEGAPEEIDYVYDNFVSIEGFTQPGYALADATPDTANGPYPLVIVSHALTSYRYVLAYLAEHLASYGFVVFAVDHTGDRLAHATDLELRMADWSGWVEAFLNAFFNRPADVQRQIDWASSLTAATGDLPGLIDTGTIAVVGWSLGGYTALTAAGAQVDMGQVRDWCGKNAADAAITASDLYLWTCQMLVPSEAQMLRAHGLDVQPGTQWPRFDVTGVDAIVPISPSASFSPETLAGIAVPVLLTVGTNEFALTLNYDHAVMAYESIPSEHRALVVFQNANHMLPATACSPWFYEHQFTYCGTDEVWDMDRGHDLLDHFVTAFLLATLKNDAEAAAALSPDAVSFPGITYQATGF